jgi:Ca2+:H+ antiporter
MQIKQALAKPSINWLAIFIPISLVVAYIPALKNEILLFFFSCLGMIVVAYWLGEATEKLAAKVGTIWGGMMNAAFSNLPELIFGLIAVSKGLGPLAKAAWTGAIISNMLVVVGAAILVGGYRYGTVTFPLDRAKDASAGLTIACVAILMPSIYAHAVDFSFRYGCVYFYSWLMVAASSMPLPNLDVQNLHCTHKICRKLLPQRQFSLLGLVLLLKAQ